MSKKHDCGVFYSTPNWRCFSHFSSRKSEQDANENTKVGVIYTQNSVFVGVTFLVGAICTSCHSKKQLTITHFCQFLGAICTEHHKFNKILIEIEGYLKSFLWLLSKSPTTHRPTTHFAKCSYYPSSYYPSSYYPSSYYQSSYYQSSYYQSVQLPTVQVSNLACKTNLI